MINTSTRAQSLSKLQAAIAQGTKVLGKLYYESSNGHMCAVGTMLTAAQRADLKKRKLNNQNLDTVAEQIGWLNLEAATGLKRRELRQLQKKHDWWADSIKDRYSPTEMKTYKTKFVKYVAKLAAVEG